MVNVKRKPDQKTKIDKKDLGKRETFGFKFVMLFLANIIIVLGSFSGLIFCINKTFKNPGGEIITYTEKGNVDYKVYLKKNVFYDKPFLNKDMVYVASLIDKIVINYNYDFNVDQASDIEYKYNIVAKLFITSQNNSKTFFEKEYVLLDAVSDEIHNKKSFNINKDVTINYAEYNNLANQFKSNYAISTISYLDVYLQVIEHGKDTNDYKLESSNKTLLRIPISEQEVNINLDNEKVNEEKQVVSETNVLIKHKRCICVDIVLFTILMVSLIRLVRRISIIINRHSYYDRYIRRLLHAYDRIIVNVTTAPNLKKYNVINVETFNELIDVRDNTKEPIKYYVIEPHRKCEFFVTNDKDLYLFIIEEVYIGEKKSKKS